MQTIYCMKKREDLRERTTKVE